MALYYKKWDNGDIAFVSGKNKIDAAFDLDEVGPCEAEELTKLPNGFILSFALGPMGHLTLEDTFSTLEVLVEIYPKLAEANTSTCGCGSEECEWHDCGQRMKAVTEAVELEKTVEMRSLSRNLS